MTTCAKNEFLYHEMRRVSIIRDLSSVIPASTFVIPASEPEST